MNNASWILEFKEKIINGSLEEALELKSRFFPKKLFQYRSVSDEKIQSLENDNVWIGSPLLLNDPYDVHIFVEPDVIKKTSAISFFKSLLPESKWDAVISRVNNGEDQLEIFIEISDPNNLRFLNMKGLNKFRNEARSYLNKQLQGLPDVWSDMRARIGVSSFSERVDSPLMWAHYAGGHKGYCVEYDFTNCDVSDDVLPVIYQDEIFECSYLLDHDKSRQLMITALVKSKDWEYEKEWRMIMLQEKALKPGLIVNVPTPKAVYLGSHMLEEDKRRIVVICKKKKIEVFKMTHSQNVFGMVAQKREKANS